MMEVVVTNRAIRRAKLQTVTTNIQAGWPSCRTTNSVGEILF